MIKKIITTANLIVKNPLSLLIVWLFFLSTPLFAFLRYYIITNHFLFSVSQRQFLNLFLLVFKWFLNLYSLSILIFWVREFNGKIIPRGHKLVLIGMGVSSFFFFLANTLLLKLEEIQFPNYLYSNFGLTTDFLESINQISLVVLLLIIFMFLDGGKLFIKFYKKSDTVWFKKSNAVFFKKINLILRVAVLGIFLFTLARSFYPLTSFSTSIKNSTQTNEQKFGHEFKFVEALRKLTPKEAFVIHPPQGIKWQLIGNQPTIRYFLYPRTLVSGQLLTGPSLTKSFPTAYFAEVYPESNDSKWPLLSTSSAKVSFDDKNYLEYEKLELVGTEAGVAVYRILFYE